MSKLGTAAAPARAYGTSLSYFRKIWTNVAACPLPLNLQHRTIFIQIFISRTYALFFLLQLPQATAWSSQCWQSHSPCPTASATHCETWIFIHEYRSNLPLNEYRERDTGHRVENESNYFISFFFQASPSKRGLSLLNFKRIVSEEVSPESWSQRFMLSSCRGEIKFLFFV